MTIDIRELFEGSGFLIQSSEHDTTNLICQRGHVYADGDSLVASMNAATAVESRKLRKLANRVVMDGSFGELSIAFSPTIFREVARIMKPRQARGADWAA
jgi:hypothetical protein